MRLTFRRSLLLLLIVTSGVTCLLAGNNLRAAQEQLPEKHLTAEQALLIEVNQLRWTNGRLPPLKANPLLGRTAAEHAQQMAFSNFFGHCRFADESQPWDRALDAGYNYALIGESIAAGYEDPREVLDIWFGVSQHREFILSNTVREIGIGYAYQPFDHANVRVDLSQPPDCQPDQVAVGPFYHYWTQVYGQRQDVFPLVINREAVYTDDHTVDLYLYGGEWASTMRFRNETGPWSAWEPFQTAKRWDLSEGLGTKEVVVELQNLAGENRTATDTIELIDPNPANVGTVAPQRYSYYLPFVTRLELEEAAVSSEIEGESIDETQDWLSYLNRFRALANLPDLAENPAWSLGAYMHSRYMVKNDIIDHQEDPRNVWYTAEGHETAQNGNVAASSSTAWSDVEPLDTWMTGPFHAIGILDPQLTTTGFGMYDEETGRWRSAATLDVLRGLAPTPASVSFPVLFPAAGQQLWLRSYDGGEYPDPLSGCAGYTAPTGPPIIIQLGDGSLTPDVISSRIAQDQQAIAHCRFDESTYVNPDPQAQLLGRQTLDKRDAVILIPQAPLEAGLIYEVEILTASQLIQWSFSVLDDDSYSNAEQEHIGNIIIGRSR